MTPFSVSVDEPSGVVQTTFAGKINYGDLRTAGMKAKQLSQERDVKNFLCCALEIELNSPVGIACFVKAYAEAGMSKGNHMAVVIPRQFEEVRNDGEIDTLARMWGFTVKRFEMKRTAIEWLTRFPRRAERRTAMEIAVHLETNSELTSGESTFTENVSARGARVSTMQRWEPNDRLWFSSTTGEFRSTARVAYCLPYWPQGFAIGIEFIQPSGCWVV